MATQNPLKAYRVFISSPGDLQQERAICSKVLAEINRGLAKDETEYRVDLVKWEDMTSSGDAFQEVLNNAVSNCDIFLMLLGSRWGTPTERYSSGTVEEFQRAIETRKHQGGKPDVLVYFKEPDPTDLQPTEQVSKVAEFKRRLSQSHLYSKFRTPQEFARQLQTQLTEWLYQKASSHKEKVTTDVAQQYSDLGGIDVWIDVGTSSREDIAELYSALSDLHRACGGVGITLSQDTETFSVAGVSA